MLLVLGHQDHRRGLQEEGSEASEGGTSHAPNGHRLRCFRRQLRHRDEVDSTPGPQPSDFPTTPTCIALT